MKSDLSRKNFQKFAESIGILEKPARRLLDRVSSMQTIYVEICRNSYLPEELKISMERLILERSFL